MVRIPMHRGVRAAVAPVLTLLVVVACQPAQPADDAPAPPAAPADLLAASAAIGLPVGMTAEELPAQESDGAAAYVEFCGACHGLPSPAAHSATDWPVVLRRMWMRSEGLPETFNVPIPDSRQRVLILDYVLDNAMQVAQTELPGGPGRDLYLAECSRCHELPDPAQHSGQDWAAVVIRMRQHMVQILRRSPAQSEVQDIILYLERASATRS
jgi:cytochrome c5